MQPAAALLVDFQNAADVAGKRRMLHGWTDGVLNAALNRNRAELMNEPDSLRCRLLLSGSILIRCEQTRRRAGAVIGEPPLSVQPDPPAAHFA